MKATYTNRYGDTIIFTETNKTTIEVTGYDPKYFRCGYDNDYSEAYEIYCLANTNNPDKLGYQEFVYELENVFHESSEPLHVYVKYVVPDFSFYSMFDPSGGPYIEVGTNVGRYFDDYKTRIVESIDIKSDRVILTVTK